MSVKKSVGFKPRKGKMKKFMLLVLTYCFLLAIIHGTADYYLGLRELVYGIYISWEIFFILIGSFGICAIYLFVFKIED